MRTVNFRDGVLYPAAYLLGIDPLKDLNRDHAQALTSFANSRLSAAWDYWAWPELTITEERAFRVIWKAGRQFQVGDELFYIPTMSYYRTISLPPIGTLPTDTNYFTPIDLTNRYIAYDQIGRRPIGQVLDLFNAYPYGSQGTFLRLPYAPTENGIQLLNGYGGMTAWLQYRIKESVFSAQAYDATRTYTQGQVVYWTDGDCYEALAASFINHTPAEPAFWRKVPMPAFLAEHLKYAIAGDAADDVNTAQIWRSDAEEAMYAACDHLMVERQQWRYAGPRRCYYFSYAPWGTATAPSGTTLTDEDDPYAPGGGIMLEDGLTPIPNGQGYVDVVFGTTWDTSSYSFDELIIKNFVDDPPLGLEVTTIANQATTGFRAMLNAPPDNEHYNLKWRVTL